MPDNHAERILARVTSRDRLILNLLAEHKFLTTSQIATIGFSSLTTCRHRLARLANMDLIRGYQPIIRDDGAHDENHWVLEDAGAYFVFVMERGHDPREVPWHRERSVSGIASIHRQHIRGCNGLMAALLGHGRRTPDADLAVWWSEQRFAQWYDRTTRRELGPGYVGSTYRPCRPDAYGVWRERGAELPFALEYDRGTETLDRLRAKLPGYTDLAVLFGRPIWVLVATTKPRRERNIHNVLGGAKVPVATAVFPDEHTPEMWRAVWHPADTESRVRLIDLVGQPWPELVRDLVRTVADGEWRSADPRTADDHRFNVPLPDPHDPDCTRHRETD